MEFNYATEQEKNLNSHDLKKSNGEEKFRQGFTTSFESPWLDFVVRVYVKLN